MMEPLDGPRVVMKLMVQIGLPKLVLQNPNCLGYHYYYATKTLRLQAGPFPQAQLWLMSPASK